MKIHNLEKMSYAIW